MSTSRDARQLRNHTSELAGAVDRAGNTGGAGALIMVVKTFQQVTYPGVANAVYACHPVDVSFPETEGATPTLTVQTNATIDVLNVGSAVPPIGTLRIAAMIDGFWVFGYS